MIDPQVTIHGALHGSGRFEPPTSGSHPSVARAPQAATTERTATVTATPRMTLLAELRAAEARASRFNDEEQRLVNAAHALAAQRDQLATRKSELEAQAAQDRDTRFKALVAGTTPPKRSDATYSLEALVAGQVEIAALEKANTEARLQLGNRRAEHSRGINDIRWRIAVGRYALAARDLLPLARELATLAGVHGKSFIWGSGLVINATGSQDIAGIPLAAALEMAANIGDDAEEGAQ